MMFHRKKKPKIVPILTITLWSTDWTEIFTGPLTDLTLRDSIIIEKSIEFFNDANPCYLHRSAVIRRLFLEMEAAFMAISHHENGTLLWAELPNDVKYLIGEDPPIEIVSLNWTPKTEKRT